MFKILIDICINLVIRSETLGETTSFCILSQIFFHFKWIHFPIYFVAFKHWTLDVYCSTELPSFFKINYIRFFMLMVFVKLKQLWATEKSTVVEHKWKTFLGFILVQLVSATNGQPWSAMIHFHRPTLWWYSNSNY